MTLIAVALAVLGPLALALVGERLNRGGPAQLGEFLAAQAVMVGLAVAVTWLGLVRLGWSADELGFRPLDWRMLALGALLALFFVYTLGPAIWALLRRARGFESGLAKLDALPIWALVLAVCVGGSCEEILYRGFAIRGVEVITGSTALAALLPLAIFAVAHVPLWGPAPAATTFVSGGVFVLVFLATRDLAPNVVSHVASDFVGIVLPRLRLRRNE